MPPPSLADRLLDAQVAWLIGRITGPEFPALVEADLRTVLAAAERTRLDAVVDADEVKQVTHRLLEQVPPSVTTTTVIELLSELVHAGPALPHTLAEVVDRASVEQLLEALPASTAALEQVLDRLSTNPQIATIASSFVARIVSDVLATNRAMAERIPGVGSLVSFGASAAGRVMGAADRPLDALIGETAAKGAGFVTKRLNRIILETLREPGTREAILAVYDQYADHALPPPSDLVSLEEAVRLGGLVQEVLIATAPSEPVTDFADALVDGFLAIYGEHSIGSLITDLGLSADDVAADLAPPLVRGVRAVNDAGLLEASLREQLEPFYRSPEVEQILNGTS